MSLPLARRRNVATRAFAITPGTDPLPQTPAKGIYIPASVTSATNMVVKFTETGATEITYSVLGPGILDICPSHVLSGPSGLVGHP